MTHRKARVIAEDVWGEAATNIPHEVYEEARLAFIDKLAGRLYKSGKMPNHYEWEKDFGGSQIGGWIGIEIENAQISVCWELSGFGEYVKPMPSWWSNETH